jgi:hypothetical protein
MAAISYKDLTSAFGAKRKWAERLSPLHRSKMTSNETCGYWIVVAQYEHWIGPIPPVAIC